MFAINPSRVDDATIALRSIRRLNRVYGVAFGLLAAALFGAIPFIAVMLINTVGGDGVAAGTYEKALCAFGAIGLCATVWSYRCHETSIDRMKDYPDLFSLRHELFGFKVSPNASQQDLWAATQLIREACRAEHDATSALDGATYPTAQRAAEAGELRATAHNLRLRAAAILDPS